MSNLSKFSGPTISRRSFLVASGGSVLATQLLTAPAEATTSASTVDAGSFTHPGLLHTADDLERMRSAVAARIAPIYDGFLAMAADDRSSYDYVIRNVGQVTSWGRDPRTT